MTPRHAQYLQDKAGHVETAHCYLIAAAYYRAAGQLGKAAAKLKLAASYRQLAFIAAHKAGEAEYFRE